MQLRHLPACHLHDHTPTQIDAHQDRKVIDGYLLHEKTAIRMTEVHARMTAGMAMIEERGMTEVDKAVRVNGALRRVLADDTLMLLVMTGTEEKETAMARPSTVLHSGNDCHVILMHPRCLLQEAATKAVVMEDSSAPAMSSARTRLSPSGRPVHLIQP